MNVLLDTNIIVDALLQQPNGTKSQQVLDIIDSGKAKGFITVGSFYTIIYLLDKNFKKNCVEKGRRIEMLRYIMDVLLDKFGIIEHEYLSLFLAVHDEDFDDMEDSCQYRAAIKGNCQMLVTENTKDFACSDGLVNVVAPEHFISLFK